MQLKRNCWKWETTSGTYFVKFYDELYNAERVKMIYEKLKKIEFPYIAPIRSNSAPHYIVQRWIDGRQAQYEYTSDRQQVLDMLQCLHETNNEVNWGEEMIPVHNLPYKWSVRFPRFLANEEKLLPLLHEKYYSIVNLTEHAMKKMRKVKGKNEKKTILHGDVVHHNFLLSDTPKMIDFDLATLGEPSDEIILWLHRVLPNVDYDLSLLLQQHPYTKNAKHKLDYLLYPNELLREWLYVLQVDDKQRSVLLEYLYPLTDQTLSKYPQLIKQIEANKQK